MGHCGQRYHVAWQILEHDFGRPELVVNAQLRKNHAYSFIKPNDSMQIVKSCQVVSGCVNVLTHFGYKMDNSSESVLNSALRKLLNDLKNKWLASVQKYKANYMNMRIFSAWLRNIAQVHGDIRSLFGSAGGRDKTSSTKDKPKITNFAATSDFSWFVNTQCPLMNEEHELWHCHAIKKMEVSERHGAVKKAIFADLVHSLVTVLVTVKPIVHVSGKYAASVIRDFCTVTTETSKLKRNKIATMTAK